MQCSLFSEIQFKTSSSVSVRKPTFEEGPYDGVITDIFCLFVCAKMDTATSSKFSVCQQRSVPFLQAKLLQKVKMSSSLSMF